jgi:hypothetical protein
LSTHRSGCLHCCLLTRGRFLCSLSGAWPYFDDVEHGRAFEPCTVNRSPDQKLLTVGDTAGHVKLYNYPCINKEVRATRCMWAIAVD